VTFDPTKFVEGEDGYIYVNVTNVGTATAEGIYGQLYKVNLDGTRKLLTDVSVLLVNDTEDNELQVGETGQLRFKYAFDSKGDYTLQVNVSADKEVASKMTDNSATKSLTVEAAWKSWLLYGGIFAVIIVVVVLFLFRKKLPMMSGKKKEPAPPAKKK
jgi:subtilase family serine protease